MFSQISVEEWDKLEDEGIKGRDALFLARIKCKTVQTFSGIRDVVKYTFSNKRH